MEQFKISDIINNAVKANRDNNRYDIELVRNFIKSIRENKELYERTVVIDSNNNNGSKLDYNVIDRILEKYENCEVIINKDNVVNKGNNLLSSRMYDKLGVVLVLFDGNPYVMIEMMILGLLTHNTMIFSYDGYMRGTNGLTLSLMQAVLENDQIDKNKFQEVVGIDEELFNNFKTINKTIIIGDNLFIDKYIKLCSTNVKVSGYGNYDIYVESLDHKDVIDKVVDLGLNINLYVREDLEVSYEDAIKVGDVEEAISNINYGGGRYSSAIFTDDIDNASLFMKEVNSNNIMVNASPTLEQALDVTQEDLLRVKNVIVPDMYKMTGERIELGN